MSVADRALASEWPIEFGRAAQVKAAAVAALFIGVFWDLLDFIPPEFGSITHRWVHEADWSHGPIIPLFSAYLVYVHWDRIRQSPVRHTWVGAVIIVVALLLYNGVTWGFVPFHYAADLAMMLCLLGVIIFLCGLPVMRYAWLPWLYLFFAVPIPRRYYFMLTDPLQRLAAKVAVGFLSIFPDLYVERVGTIIHPTYHGQQLLPLSVTDACSGMRSTMVLCALGTAVAFMVWRPWWHRVILLAACVPIATFCNVIRVTVTCGLHILVDPQYATGTYHMVLGLVVILLAVLLFLGLGWMLSNLFVEDRDDEPRASGAASGGARA